MLPFLALHEIAAVRGDGLRPELVHLLERHRAHSESRESLAVCPDKLSLSTSSHVGSLEGEHWALLRRASNLAPWRAGSLFPASMRDNKRTQRSGRCPKSKI